MNKQLTEMADQLSRMTPKGTEQETYFNFAFGALYALARAEELGYNHQNKTRGKSTRRSAAVAQVATRMAQRGVMTWKGEWVAGYFYNDALLRADIAYEHILRYRTGQKKANGPRLLKKAIDSKMPKSLLIPSWTRVRDEVNNLKHRSWEFGEGPDIELDEALGIIQDLIKTVEWALKHGDTFGRKPRE